MQDIVIKIKNVENRINELKSELSIVWDNAYSFNSGYTSLKTCLYKATNAKYYNRLIDNNNEELLKERDIYLQSIDLIIENIKLIDAYYSLYDELITKKSSASSLSNVELVLIFKFFDKIVDDYSYSGNLYLNEMITIREMAIDNNLLDEEDLLYFNYLLIKGYSRDRYYFRARKYVNENLDKLRYYEITKENYTLVCEMYDMCSNFYKRVLDVRRAMNCLKVASKIALGYSNISLSSEYLAKCYRFMNYLPIHLQEGIKEKEIERLYQEYSKPIFEALTYKGLLVDEIEHDENFLSLFDEVNEEVERRIDIEGELFVPFQRWNIMQEEYLKRGISWKTPKQMNPHVMFD